MASASKRRSVPLTPSPCPYLVYPVYTQVEHYYKGAPAVRGTIARAMAKASDRVGALKLILSSSQVERAYCNYQNLHGVDEEHELINKAIVAAERKAEQVGG